MADNPLVSNLLSLKSALEDLETAVKEPRDQPTSIQHVTEQFLPVFDLFAETLKMLLDRYDVQADSTEDVMRQAHLHGWLRGDLPLWLHMAADYERLRLDGGGDAGNAITQDIRACAWLLWQTHELLMAKFRWQTEVVKNKQQAV